jgi:hypothetical protein
VFVDGARVSAEPIVLHDNAREPRQLICQLGDARLVLRVGDNHLRPRQSECVQQEVALVGRVHGGGHRADASGAQPEVDPLRAGSGEQCDAIARSNTQVQQRISGNTGPLTHLLEGHVDVPDRHHHPVGVLLGTTIEDCRDAESLDPEISWADGLSVASGCRPNRHAGHQAPAAAGSGSPLAV